MVDEADVGTCWRCTVEGAVSGEGWCHQSLVGTSLSQIRVCPTSHQPPLFSKWPHVSHTRTDNRILKLGAQKLALQTRRLDKVRKGGGVLELQVQEESNGLHVLHVQG